MTETTRETLNATRLAIGLAAIDGLTCAFVAILALSLSLQGAEVVAPSPFNVCSDRIDFLKDSETVRGLRMSVYVKAKLEGKTSHGVFAPIADNARRETNVEILDRHHAPLLKDVNIFWIDCLGSECSSSSLLLTGAPPRSEFQIVIRAANTVGDLADRHPDSIDINARLLALAKERTTTVVERARLSFESGGTGGHDLKYAYNCSPEGVATLQLLPS